jgi:hypothetical protein
LSTVLSDLRSALSGEELVYAAMPTFPGRVIATASAVALLAACGGDPSPATLPPASGQPSTAASTSPSDGPAAAASTLEPSVAAPPTRSEPTDETSGGAVTDSGSGQAEPAVRAAVEKYYADLNTSLADTDSTEFRKNFLPHCKPCEQSADVIDNVESDGKQFAGANYRIEAIRVQDVAGITAAAEVTYRVSAHRIVTSDGETVKKFNASDNRVHLSLQKTQNGWVVVNAFGLGV